MALLSSLREGHRVEEPFGWLVAVVRNQYARQCRLAREAWPNGARVAPAPGAAAQSNESREPCCRAERWGGLEALLDALRPALSGEDKELIRSLAAGETRRAIAKGRHISVDVVEGRAKKILERIRFLVEETH